MRHIKMSRGEMSSAMDFLDAMEQVIHVDTGSMKKGMRVRIRFFTALLGIACFLLVLNMISTGNRTTRSTKERNRNINAVLSAQRRLVEASYSGDMNEGGHKDSKVDVLVLGYARGGSTYVGQMLGYNEDTFYFYEPLYDENDPLRYYRNNSICEMNGSICRPISSSKVSRAVSMIELVFSCDPLVFPQFIWKWQREMGGTPWESRNLTEKCKKSKYRVAKVLRLSAELVEGLLERNPRLRLMYLYRDPRGIINSRLKLRNNVRWDRTMKNTEDVAKGVCRKMEQDAQVVLKLMQNKKNRNKILLADYEGLAKYPEERSKHIFNFLGIHVSKQYINKVSQFGKQSKKSDQAWNSALRSDGYAASIKWRKDLAPNDKSDIDKHCESVYRLLGYE